MSVFFRVEVKNKTGMLDPVGEALKDDISDLGIKSVHKANFVQVYNLTGDMSREDTLAFSEQVLTDSVTQEFSLNDPFFSSRDKQHFHVVEVAYNPGVMDPVEESLIKASKDFGMALRTVSTAKKYVLTGDLSRSDLKFITEQLLYNKTVQHIVEGQDRRPAAEGYAFRKETVGLLDADDQKLLALSREGQLYLTLPEMKAIRSYFEGLGRDPTKCEIETLAQTWSEHCKHKTMMGRIAHNGRVYDNLLKETVMKATLELDLPWCVSVFKDNAGIIEFDQNHNICFKVETHNHPSALEPYGGSETGIGGVIRDTLGTGRGAKPVASSDVFCLGIPDMVADSVPDGCLHPKRVLKGVVTGVRDYGNKMGIPTVNGAICFDSRYTANPLVFCGNVGILPKEHSSKKVSPGELIVLVGGRTGRDGIHGATFSSGELNSESEKISSTAVQIGDPITEKKIVDTILRARDKCLYEAITDCGAGGLSSAVGEMGESTGALVHLEKVPLKYEGLKPWEIWISEAQERMVIAVRPEKVEELLQIFLKEDVEATVIGSFTDTGKLELFYEGKPVAHLDMHFLHNGLPDLERQAITPEEKERSISFTTKEPACLNEDLLDILGSWNVCSKEWVIRQYDHEVQGGSVLKPLTGIDCDAPSDAAVIRPLLSSPKGIALGCGICPDFSSGDAYSMAASAIEEALRQIVSVGGDISRTALLDNFCWGSSDDPVQLGAMVRACEACYDLAKRYGTPFISGKDSLNNQFNTGSGTVSIPPTLLISAICVVEDAARTISMDAKEPFNALFVVGRTYQEMLGSQYAKVKGLKGGRVPKIRMESSLKTLQNLTKAINGGIVVSAHDCSEGGLGVCIAEMLFGGDLGADITFEGLPREKELMRADVALFSESNSRFVVEVPWDKQKEFTMVMNDVEHALIGRLCDSPRLSLTGFDGKKIVDADVSAMKEAWKRPFKEIMHVRG